MIREWYKEHEAVVLLAVAFIAFPLLTGVQ